MISNAFNPTDRGRVISSLIKARRSYIALRDKMMPVRDTYAQDGEDRIALKYLKKAGKENGIYVDVGANQPTQISNTYLFYRMGQRGISIEPNRKMDEIYKKTRPRDIFFNAACGSGYDILEFKYSSNSGISGFLEVENVVESYLVPVVPLDEIMSKVEYEYISLLSIDTEGFDYDVIKGSSKTLKDVEVVVVEGKKNGEMIDKAMDGNGFALREVTDFNKIYASENIN